MSKAIAQVSRLPPLRLYPERAARADKGLDRLATAAMSAVRARLAPILEGRLSGLVPRVTHYSKLVASLSDQELREFASNVRVGLIQNRFNDSVVAQVFALVREVAK